MPGQFNYPPERGGILAKGRRHATEV